MKVSDISVLTYEYHRDATLAEQLNQALIVLHKAHLRLLQPHGADEAISASSKTLAGALEALLALLQPSESGEITAELAARIPLGVAKRMQAGRSGDLGYFLDDISCVLGRLRQRPPIVTERDLKLLNELAAVTDAEASRVFRRLMRV
jgi:hypothetical protein